MAERDFATAEKAEGPLSHPESNSSGEMVENAKDLKPELTHDSVLGMQSHGHFGEDQEQDNPHVHQHMNLRLFMSLTAMSFLWVGSQIPLFLFGSVLPDIYGEVGGAEGRWLWLIIGYLIPNAALCPFVGAMSDLFGRKWVAAFGQITLMVGPVVTATSNSINIAIAGMVISGFGAGLNELIALAGTSELVPIRKRSSYVGGVVFTILPFCPSPLWAQLIARYDWRWNGLLIGIWNLVGLILVVFLYEDPAAKHTSKRPAKEVLSEIDYVGGLLSICGITTFMMGMQWGASQYEWTSAQVLAPFLIGAVLIICFFVWEMKFAKFPMCPKGLFRKDKRSMISILLITFFSGGNFFAILLFWPTQVYNMYGNDPIDIGVRTLPIGFGIIAGALIGLVLIGVTKGRTWFLMLFFTCGMTAFVGSMATARVDNLTPQTIALITMASIFVGAVIIPGSIIAQVVCPTEFIGTVTAITLAIRYVGGAIGFTVYYNIFYANLEGYVADGALLALTQGGLGVNIPDTPAQLIEEMTHLFEMAARAQYAQLEDEIANGGFISEAGMADAYDIIFEYTRPAFAQAYRYPYFISIAFGVCSIICALFLGDIRKHLLAQKGQAPSV